MPSIEGTRYSEPIQVSGTMGLKGKYIHLRGGEVVSTKNLSNGEDLAELPFGARVEVIRSSARGEVEQVYVSNEINGKGRRLDCVA